jgi:predicted short-subunit dehydrogenase-like oxidoreductase (DUF2520 family)
MQTVNIIGAGRVGRTFLQLLGTKAQDIASATRASAEAAVEETGHGHATDLTQMRPADIWLLTVPDTQITSAAEALARMDAPPAIAVHCSGFHKADVMSPLKARGWLLASAHPNLSFADPGTAAARFRGTPCGIEGDTEAVETIEVLLTLLGAKPFRIESDRKALYHAAAVFSNNFATVCQAIARAAWKDAGVPDGIATDLNASLLNATVENVVRYGPVEALTGPAARGDTAVVEAQAQCVAEWNDEAGRLYRAFSEMAARLKSTGSI